MNLLARLWKNAEWELRFPLFISPGDSIESILRPPPVRVLARVFRLLIQKVLPDHRMRRAVLTFDDGPFTDSTLELLQVLAREDVVATFFLVGNEAATHSDLTRAIVAAGHEIASHSWRHPRLSTLEPVEQLAEIQIGCQLIEEASGQTVRFFRPPHGDFDAVTLEEVRKSGHIVSLWNVNPADYDDISSDTIVERLADQRRNPAVILLHSGRPETIKSIPAIVRHYRENRFIFTTLGTFFEREVR